MITPAARTAAASLRASIGALDAVGVSLDLGELSRALGGIPDLQNMPWSPALQVAYVLALVVENIAAPEESKVLNLHGVPMSKGGHVLPPKPPGGLGVA